MPINFNIRQRKNTFKYLNLFGLKVLKVKYKSINKYLQNDSMICRCNICICSGAYFAPFMAEFCVVPNQYMLNMLLLLLLLLSDYHQSLTKFIDNFHKIFYELEYFIIHDGQKQTFSNVKIPDLSGK